MPYSFTIKKLTKADVALMGPMLDMFGEAFDEKETYGNARPQKAYLERLLAGESFIALVALAEGKVAGGIAAYELHKFEQERSEIFIYDLAVAEEYRRQGIATALIEEIKQVAANRGAYLVVIAADAGDEPAIALYDKLGVREEVLHFDIAIGSGK